MGSALSFSSLTQRIHPHPPGIFRRASHGTLASLSPNTPNATTPTRAGRGRPPPAPGSPGEGRTGSQPRPRGSAQGGLCPSSAARRAQGTAARPGPAGSVAASARRQQPLTGRWRPCRAARAGRPPGGPLPARRCCIAGAARPRGRLSSPARRPHASHPLLRGRAGPRAGWARRAAAASEGRAGRPTAGGGGGRRRAAAAGRWLRTRGEAAPFPCCPLAVLRGEGWAAPVTPPQPVRDQPGSWRKRGVGFRTPLAGQR